MNVYTYVIIILMAIVTYLPRMIPMVALGEKTISGFWGRVLKFVPVVALTALVVPSGLFATSSPATSLAGLATAVALSFFKCSLIVIVLGSVGAALLVGVII